MSPGLARIYNQRPPYQLIDLLQGQTTAEGIRKVIQDDSLVRLKTFQWRRGLKLEGENFPTLVRVKIPEGMPLAGDYIDNVGDVFDSKEGGLLSGYFGEEANQTALVFLRRPGERVSSIPAEPVLPISAPPAQIAAEVGPAAPPSPDHVTLPEPKGEEVWEELGDLDLPVPKKPTTEITELPAPPVSRMPDSLAKVGEYLDNMQTFTTIIRYGVRSLDEFIHFYGHHFQPGGFFIKTPTPFPVGSILEMELRLKNEDLVLKGEGQVAWRREVKGSSTELPPGMGIRFLRLEPESRQVLKKILAEKK